MCINRGIMLIEFIWVTISIIKIKNTGSLRKNASIHPNPPPFNRIQNTGKIGNRKWSGDQKNILQESKTTTKSAY
jgi:hypothetical protein